MSELPIDFFKKLEETKRNLDQQIQTMKEWFFISDCKLFSLAFIVLIITQRQHTLSKDIVLTIWLIAKKN